MAKQHGYAGKIIKANLSSGRITRLPTADYSDRFIGGRGIAAKLYWDMVSPEVQAFDPQNCLIMVTGPLAGFPGLSGSRWQVYGKSPSTMPQHFSYCNLGGTWGAELKFAGYDGVVIDGKANRPVYIFIEDDTVEIRDASDLWGQGAIETRTSLKGKLGESAKVLAIGPAGENMVVFASLLADQDSSGSSGLGAIWGAKNLKAVVVRGSKRAELKAADGEKLKQITRELQRLLQVDVPWQPWTSTKSTGYEVKRKACWGCIKGCQRGLFTPSEGEPGKFMCQSAWFYKTSVGDSYEKPGWEVLFRANKLCDTYGVDTMVMEAIIKWLVTCHQSGILSDDNTGLPLSKMGSVEFIETLLQKISHRDGFGDILAQGLVTAANSIGKDAEKLIEGQLSKAGEVMAYEPRLYITTALFYAMEPRRPIHQLHQTSEPVLHWRLCGEMKQGYYSTDVLRRVGKRFLGSELAVDFSTYDGKALAAKMIQDREYAGESMVTCNSVWPISESEATEDHVGDPTIYSRTLSAITGMEVDGEEELYRIGERIFNMQRAVLVREGHKGRTDDTLPDYFFTTPLEGTRENPDCLLPGKDGELISRKGEVIDRLKFEEMKEEYYQLRGWDKTTGLQTKAKLKELGLQDIISDLEQRGLVV